MPFKNICVSIYDYFDSTGFQSGKDWYNLGSDNHNRAIDILQKHFEPLGYEVDIYSVSKEDYEVEEINEIRLKISNPTTKVVIKDLVDIRANMLRDIDSPEQQAFEMADKEFQKAIETELDVVAQHKLKDLGLLLGQLNSHEAIDLLEKRFKDPMFSIRDIAEKSESIAEYCRKMKEFIHEVTRESFSQS